MGEWKKRGWEVYGRREKRGRKRYSQGGGKREKNGKLCNIVQYFAIERRGGSQQIHNLRSGVIFLAAV